MNSEYQVELRKLSINARSAVALLVCEEYFRKYEMEDRLTRDFLEHLWEWPVVKDFEAWEKSRPSLVNYGLGEDASPELLKIVSGAGLDERKIREIISNTVEVLWGSFWGAAEDNQSFKALIGCIESSGLVKLPVLTPFKFSTFSDGDGWGIAITTQDRDYWRYNAVFL